MLNLFMTFMIMGPGSSPDPNIYYRTRKGRRPKGQRPQMMSELHDMVDICHVAAGIAVLHPHEEIQLVDALAGAGAAVFDKGDLQPHRHIHHHIADDAAGAAGGDG